MTPPPEWLDPAREYLIGISGGRDSVFLHHWLVAHGFHSLHYAHLNHGLRGAESDGDESFLKKLLGDRLLSEKINVEDLARTNGLSIETAAREARHDFFARCALQTGTNTLLLAHHAEDQAETALFNLLRGSAGAKGMSSSQQMGPLTILRPMLPLRRKDIQHYLNSRRFPFREDSSNQLPFASRNRLRNEALPLLADIMGRDPVPALTRAVAQTAELEELVDQLFDPSQLLDPQGRLFLPKIRQIPPALQRRTLFRYFKDHQIPQISASLIDQALDIIPPDAPPALTLPGGLRLRRKESRLFISP
ncbi:tRNA lysidine(34) synthetase TilS [Verrucomicrobiaceae bacterium 227]